MFWAFVYNGVGIPVAAGVLSPPRPAPVADLASAAMAGSSGERGDNSLACAARG